jgi:hypothetical protein
MAEGSALGGIQECGERATIEGVDLFDSPILRIEQPGKLLPTRALYRILDAGGKPLAVVTEADEHTRLQVLKGMRPGSRQPGTRLLTITAPNAPDQPVLVLTTQPDGRHSEVRQPDGELVGRISAVRTTRHLQLSDDQDEPLAEVAGDLSLRHFTVTATAGDRLAVLTKTWAGLVKELLTPSDNYRIEFSGTMTPPVRTLIALSAIVIDVTLYGPV